MGLILGGLSARDLILDGQSVALYVGGNPPTKVWPNREVVQITLGDGSNYADGQLRKALIERGLEYDAVEKIPFDIELVGSGDLDYMFAGYLSLTHAPAMDTSNVTSMRGMFEECTSLVYVPDMHTRNVEDMYSMFYDCSSLTDGNVRLIGRHPRVDTYDMILDSGLTRKPFYDTSGNPI